MIALLYITNPVLHRRSCNLVSHCRNRLSYEQFAAFLANIKELNAQRQSREVGTSSSFPNDLRRTLTELLLMFTYTAAPQETLRKADEIFGAENKDLFMSFQGLLSRSLS